MKIYSKLDKEINKTIKNFNQKISRLESNENKLLPQKVNKQMFKNMKSTTDVRRKLNELRRFSRRGAEEILTLSSGTEITKYERREIQIAQRTAKAKVTRELKKLEITKPKIAGIESDYTFAQMGDEGYLNLIAKKEFLKNKKVDELSLKDLRNLRKSLDVILKTRDTNFQDSYLKMIEDIGYISKYDPKKLGVIVDKLESIINKDFIKLSKNEKLIKSLIYYYPSLKNGNIILDNEEEVNSLLDSIYDYLGG